MSKKKTFLTLSSLTFIMLGVSFSIASPVEKAESYNGSTLPSTINLNRVKESDIRDYYSSLSGKSGEIDILSTLKNILMNNQKYYVYDSSNNLWQMYEIIDRDWTLSPASEITNGTYNSKTNTITNYKYGNMDNPLDNPYLHSLYVNRDMPNPKRAWTSHGERSNEATIEREHIWPKSHGFDETITPKGGARGDPMHLWSADGAVNGVHSNYYYGNVDKTKITTDCSTKFNFTKYNYLGVSERLGNNIKVFEPQDSDKGDIARACFYMVARYNNRSGLDNTIDSNNPNLTLDDNPNLNAGASTADTPFSLGILSDLLEWNKLDPVDDFEIYRNDLLYNNYTNNRNPFIDFPQWADYIWGDKSTTSINPTSDPLHGEGMDEVKLTLSNSSIAINNDEQTTITAKASDENIYTVNWINSNNEVATINKVSTTTNEELTITPLSIGTTTLTGSINVSGNVVSASCVVTVKDNKITLKITKEDFAIRPDYSTPETINKTIRNTGDLTLISHETSRLENYGYEMFNSNEGYIYNDTAPNGYYPKNITITFSGSTSEKGKIGISYSSTKLTKRDSLVDNPVTKSGTYSLENNNDQNIYWNISTASYNVQIKSIEIVYVKLTPEVLLSKEKIKGVVDSTKTVTATTKNFINDTITYSWSIEDTDIATLTAFGNTATIALLAEGETILECIATCGDDSANIAIPITVSLYGDDNTTIDFTSGYENQEVITTKEIKYNDNTYLSATADKGSGTVTPKYYTNGNAIRLYAGNTITITSVISNIKMIKFIFGSADGNNTISVDKGLFTDDTWIGISNDNLHTDEVTFSIDGTSGNRRIQKIMVFYYSYEDFSLDFLEQCKCNPSGTSRPNVDWVDLENKFNLLFDMDKDVLRNETADQDGEVTAQTVAKYDYIVGKYGKNVYKDFIERNPSLSAYSLNFSFDVFDITNSNNYSLMIIVCLSITLISFISYLLLRRKQR